MKTGDIIVRDKSGHKGMKAGDMDEILNFHDFIDIDLVKYGVGHSGNSLRLATEEEKQQYYAKHGIIVNNYQIY